MTCRQQLQRWESPNPSYSDPPKRRLRRQGPRSMRSSPPGQVAEQHRAALLNAKLMGVRGEVQIEGRVIHVIAKQLIDHSEMLGGLMIRSRDFR